MKRIIRAATKELLLAIGEDQVREGLLGTPDRVARFWDEFINYEPGKVDVTFKSIEVNQLVLLNLTDPIYSLCEHHLLPIEMYVSIGYISEGAKVLGVSKLARVAQKHAHRLQIQERYTSHVAVEISQLAHTESVAVLVRGKHLCMVMRGVGLKGYMITSSLQGSFKTSDRCRNEFLQLTNRK